MTVRYGDLVRLDFPDHRTMKAIGVHVPPVVTGVVVGRYQRFGSQGVIVMDDKRHLYCDLDTGCVALPNTPALLQMRSRIIQYARSKDGKKAIMERRKPPTAYLERVHQQWVRKTVETKAPPGGTTRGFPHRRFEPMVLTEGLNGTPTDALLDYCDFWGGRWWGAFNQLSPPIREALDLVERQGFSHDEAALHLRLLPATLRQRLWRGRRALRRAIGTSDGLYCNYDAGIEKDVA